MSFLANIDPDMAAMLGELPVYDLSDIPAAREERKRLARVIRDQVPPNPAVRHGDHTAPGLPGEPDARVRVYEPVERTGEPLPALIWMHGGGHVMGEIWQDDPVVESIVDAVGCVAVSIDWRHAPENPFPASLHDSYAGLLWTVANADRLGVDAGRVAVGGASSGGGLAAGIALMARDRGDARICHQSLTYPMLDDTTDGTGPHQALDHPGLWNRGKNNAAWKAYLGAARGGDAVSPYAAPARATDLAGLPPAFIGTGDLDLFAFEDLGYARRLVEAGVPVELRVYPGGVHGFELFTPHSRIGGQMLRDRADALRAAFASR